MKACQAVENPDEIRGRIAVMERGECMFIDKVGVTAKEWAAILNQHSKVPFILFNGDGLLFLLLPSLSLLKFQARHIMAAGAVGGIVIGE